MSFATFNTILNFYVANVFPKPIKIPRPYWVLSQIIK